MTVLAIIIFVLSCVLFVIASSNWLFRQSFTDDDKTSEELISVLIPARNEEDNIIQLMHDVLKQSHLNLELLVYDDQSSDRTAERVHLMAEMDPRVRLLQGGELEDGWYGKNQACYKLALAAQGTHLLFLDADVRIGPDVLHQALNFAQVKRLSLLSVFPQQIMQSFSEKITVPLMNYILLTLLPLPLVMNNKRASLSAANGQFMFFSARVYHRLQPHSKHRNKMVEDIETARYFKRNGERIACLAARSDIRCRMYNRFPEALEGFSKNALMFFGGSVSIALLYWFINTFGIFITLFSGSTTLLILHMCVLLMTSYFVSISSGQKPLNNLLLWLPQQFTLGIILLKAIRNHSKKQFIWKGRKVY